MLAPCIGLDDARISGKAFTADKTFDNTQTQHGLEQLTERVAVTEPTMAVLGERRVIRHPVMDAKMTEPAVRQIQMHFLAQPALRPNAVTIADDQHAHDQLRI